jgi:two-component system, sensor histidine kinase and response regulator
MNGLISDLLEFSKLGRKEIEKEDLNMDEVVKEALAGVHNANPQFKAEVILHPLLNSMADRGLMSIVFTNLLTNAFKYSSKKPQPVIEVGGYEDDDKNIYFIKDNGAGFDMKYVDKLFIVFSRLHSDFEFEGTGIGLATVFKIITKHKGKIWAEAEEGKGATFYFSMPK